MDTQFTCVWTKVYQVYRVDPKLFYTVEARCNNFIPCNDKELTCVVCTKWQTMGLTAVFFICQLCINKLVYFKTIVYVDLLLNSTQWHWGINKLMHVHGRCYIFVQFPDLRPCWVVLFQCWAITFTVCKSEVIMLNPEWMLSGISKICTHNALFRVPIMLALYAPIG